MIVERLSERGRRALALGLLAAVVLLAVAAAAVPAWLVYRQRTELVALERRIVDLRRRLPAREGLIAEERLLGRADALERALLRGSTPALAAAALQGDVTALASAMGAVVTSVQILDAEPAPPFTDVGLRLTMVSDISTLRDFLYAVETREPVMLLRSFSLGRADGGSGGEPLPGGSEPLTTTVEIRGYLAGVAPGAAPGTATPSSG
ncbi:MAG TPA: type II secretion system protein GspM [Geminicoccaceae bacterium]